MVCLKVFRCCAYGLISLAAALVFHTCTQVPEYCGDGSGRFDTKNQFCFEGAAYVKCGGNTYDPINYQCNDRGQIVPKTPATPPATTYAVTVSSESTGATGTGRYAVGDTVTIRAGTVPGYTFKNWTTTSGGVTLASADSAATKFKMPANDVTVTAAFEQAIYAVTVAAGRGATGGGNYVMGATVSISAGTPPTDQQRFKNWMTASGGVTFANAAGAATTFTMPANAVAVMANFEAPPPNVSYGTFIDHRDNQEYKTVKIGGRTWMARNLNYETKIGEGNSWCYGNNNDYCETYGRLYDWGTAATVCPSGWHLPSRREWGDLAIAAGGTGDYGKEGPASKELRATYGWYNNDGISTYGTDAFGFSALPGGSRYPSSSTYYIDGLYIIYNNDRFSGAGLSGYWWIAQSVNHMDGSWGYRRVISSTILSEEFTDIDRRYGHSVRCVQNYSTSNTYWVTVSSAGTGYSGGGSYENGATVTISAGTPPSGKRFWNWTTTSSVVTFADANSETTTFTMPASAVRVTANFVGSGVQLYTLTDVRDNQAYNTVKIGNQTWMAENLNYQTPSGSWCYGDSADNCAKYGRLYAWDVAKTVCPAGWKLPDTADWRKLVEVAGDSSVAGNKLKSTSGWGIGSSYNGTDDFGFSALPGGDRHADGSFNHRSGNLQGLWWAATEFNDKNALSYIMTDFNAAVKRDNFDKVAGYSVRCVQD